jgi:hypothetical protein
MDFRITKCEAEPKQVRLIFSKEITIDPSAAFTITDTTTGVSQQNAPHSALGNRAVLLQPTTDLTVGDWVLVQVSGITSQNGDHLKTPMVGAVVEDPVVEAVLDDPRIRRIGEAVEDAVSYPVLTEPVSFAPASPGGVMMNAPAAQPGAPLTGIVGKALTDVLGWKVNTADAKGFVGALTQSFTLTLVEGHTEAAWNPRSYAVQTDLSGGITGAQASLYTRAQDASDKGLPLLDGLYPLDPEAEPEDVTALRELAKSQLGEIVREFGAVGGPSVLRVDTYFQILIGTPVPAVPGTTPPTDADNLTDGTLKDLRDVYGLAFLDNPFSNSIADEQDITNFRIIVDYVISLFQTWVNNRQFFTLGNGTQSAFFGTQLVLISRQLSVILETVNEVRFALDSVFIGPSERQTLLIQFPGGDPPPIFLEDMLNEFQDFFGDEGPRLLRDGGRLAVKSNILPVVRSFSRMAEGARRPANLGRLPDGFRTPRVRRSLDDLHSQTRELVKLVEPVKRDLPPPEPSGGRLLVLPSPVILTQPSGSAQVKGFTGPASVSNIGNAPVTGIKVTPRPDIQTTIVGGQSFPATLQPNQSLTISITFTGDPKNPGTLEITADRQDPRQLPLTTEVTLSTGA